MPFTLSSLLYALCLSLADLLRSAGQYLFCFASVPINRDPLAPFPISRQKGLADILPRRNLGEIDRLRHGIIRVFLEGSLNSNMPDRRDLKRCNEEIFHLSWNLRKILEADPFR